MDTNGYSAISGHGVIAATTIALERGLLVTAGDGLRVVWDTPAGAVRARATRTGSRVDRVSFTSVPSFVLHGGLPVTLRGRTVRADVVYAGEFYAIVDAESVGLAIDPAHVPEIRRLAAAIRDAIQSSHTIVHPLDSRLEGIDGVIITGPAHGPGADLRNVTVLGTQVDRSPCGAGTAAVMSVIDAMALMAEDTRFVQESLIGTRLSGRVVERTQVGDYPAIVTEIEGSAWITGEHTFLVDAADPLRNGFRL
jgi:proline racemase